MSMTNNIDTSLIPLRDRLESLAPRIELAAGAVKVLSRPVEFYDLLKQKIRSAERRIFLSTLYIGKSEHELVETLHQALSAKPSLKLSILTDALRSTRESPKACCASLLVPLIRKFGPDRVEISMFHTPNLHGLRKSLMPRRFDEGWGLQHMKLYGFDDEIMLSGANLSSDYFTDRQDRYHLFASKELTTFYERLHDAISSVSYSLRVSEDKAGFSLVWPSVICPAPTKDPKAYKRYTNKLLRDVVRFQAPKQVISNAAPVTIMYPLVQMTPLLNAGNSTEQPSLNTVLDTLSTPQHAATEWYFTAGYFNVFKDYRTRLVKAVGHGCILTASPDANGFYKSPGPSGMLTAAYTLLTKRFMQDVQKSGKTSAISVSEWKKGSYGQPDRWTYHAKGLWIRPRSIDTSGPSLTFLGSSNMTRRSQNLDLEATAILLTADQDLQEDLANEVANLMSNCTQIGIKDLEKPERKASIMTRISLWLCQGML